MSKRQTKPKVPVLVGVGGESPTNGAEDLVAAVAPYIAKIRIRGVCPILFRRWNCEEVEEKAKAKKGSDIKKQFIPENCIWRDDKKFMCIPGEYFRQSLITAAKFVSDPRSPRKSAKDLFTAGLIIEEELSPILVQGKKITTWDYVDKRRVMVQRNGITRERPALNKGWEAEFLVLVNLSEYVSRELLGRVVFDAGRLAGLADFRPSYGRYETVSFEVLAYH